MCVCVFRLQEILEVADDMAIDIPHIWPYLAEIITPVLHDGGIPMGLLFRSEPYCNSVKGIRAGVWSRVKIQERKPKEQCIELNSTLPSESRPGGLRFNPLS